ncbi:GNAT family N-acetyltransferase [Actinomycetospora cinnamomea]|uniref:Ribosomal-protein-alanine N-acetyltransferase n=1 Tax=Actinomycetospora cinnamomea TaxID=663609 RepID=A0A2U1FS27_9PSEU|nr:GNAT family protein [Actinomycetospora cinnamomea]PVZ14968.1 ribosomal-protein-alanine N-acetyltransferase [Actinomycetospora cinnamomea]
MARSPRGEARPTGRHPGWPARTRALRVPAGVVELRPIRLRDGAAWARIRLRDEEHLAPWEPTPPGPWADRNALAEWPARWSALRSMGRAGRALPFALLVDGAFAGQVVVGDVVREPLLSAYVGYWVGAHVVGGGAATAAVALAVDHCFSRVGLHRVEATVRPENVRSRRVLAKLGFREEGLLRRYLEVDGDWRDHLVLALTTEDVLPDGLVARLLRAGRAERA